MNLPRLENLIKWVIFVTLLQSAIIIWLEIYGFYKERLYLRKIQQANMFYFDEEDMNNDDILEFEPINFKDIREIHDKKK